MAEDSLRITPGLKLTILRPAIIYGTGDTGGLSK